MSDSVFGWRPDARRRGLIVVLAAILPSVASVVGAADWPTYQHDDRRSGITDERLAPPLAECWTFESPHPPAPGWADPEEPDVWSYGVQRVARVRYDDAFQVAAVDGSVYFASTAENKLYAIDASSGAVRWVHYTSAPARLAPTVWEGKVYLGGDNGHVTCLDTVDGRVIWRFQAAPTGEHVVGQGRLMSLWPVRSGLTVDRGIAYFSAGLFPAEGLYLFAVDAADGRLLWRNDSFDADGKASISPQGYLLASRDKLFLPSGRVSPAVFARDDGRLLYQVENGWGLIGGDYAMLTEECLYSGTQQVMAYDLEQGKRIFSWFDGRRILVDDGTAYVVTGSEMLAVAVDRMADVAAEVDKLRKISWDNRNAMGAYRRAWEELDSMEPDDPRRRRLEDDVKKNRPPYDAWDAERRRLDDYLDSVCQWRTSCETWESLILARDVLWAGGLDHVLAVDARDGEKLWTAQVPGTARGLAVADGRLLVSTTTGAVHCFRELRPPGGSGRLPASVPRSPPSPTQVDVFHQRVADRILRETDFTRGYALLLDDKRARLAVALAQRTELTIHVVLDEQRDVAQAREVLDRAGLHGSRVSVERGSLAEPAYPPYFSNLIVSTEAFQGHPLSTPADELVRMLRPHGGLAYAGQPSELDDTNQSAKPLDQAAIRGWLAALHDPSATVGVDRGWVRIRRGPLPGAGSWSHQYADAGASGCSEDRVAKPPFGVLWFGEPGPRDVLERHARAPAPLSVDGRLFLLGRDVVLAHDAYNGTPLWRRELEGAQRQGLPTETSSMAASSDGLFVLVNDKCLRLDPATGQTLSTYVVPPRGPLLGRQPIRRRRDHGHGLPRH